VCNFFSAVGLRDGSIRWHWALDSHSDILTYYGIEDEDDYQTRFVKLELKPGENWLDPNTWTFSVDEETAPVWCDDERQVSFRAEMIRIAQKMILTTGEKRLIVDGVWIIGGDANVRDVRGGRMRLQDNATISDVGSNVNVIYDCRTAVGIDKCR